MLARLKRFSFISIPNDRQFVKRVSEKILMDLAILRGICSLQAEKTFFHGIFGEEQLGGASADAQSYWQGRFAACAFVCSPKLPVKNQKIPRIVRDSRGTMLTARRCGRGCG